MDDASLRQAIVLAKTVELFLQDLDADKYVQALLENIHILLQAGGMEAVHKRILEVRAMPAPLDFREIQF